MTRSLLPALLSLGLCASCARLPESFAPPAQHAALASIPLAGPGNFFSMADSNAADYLVSGVADHGPGTWRWTYDHPVLRFFVPALPDLRFSLEFTLPQDTFRHTGPVTLSISLNGQALDRIRYDQAGQHSYSHPVPPAMIYPGALNFIAIDPHPVWISPDDGAHLGFILSRAGFTE